MKKFLLEFKEFAMRGNVLDMAIGVVLGTAFSAIVNSLVSDVFMPLVGLITGGVNFSGLSFGLGEAQIAYGNFIQATVQFVLIALCVFLMIKAINLFHKKKEEPAPPQEPKPSKEELLLTEIRDLLRARQ